MATPSTHCGRIPALLSGALLLAALLAPATGTALLPLPPGPSPAALAGGAVPVERPQPPRPGEVVELEAALESIPLVRGASVRAAVELQIADNFHVNANPPTHDYLIPTTVTVDGVEAVTVAREHHPQPVSFAPSFSDEPLDVYEGRAVVGLTLEVGSAAPLGHHVLSVVVRYQACDDRACFAPTTARHEIPVVVAAAGTSPEPTGDPLLERAPFPDGEPDGDGTSRPAPHSRS